MRRLTLKRLEATEGGTRGVLMMDGIVIACTVELPWLNNQVNVSCIPCGVYPVVVHESPSRGWVFWIKDVPGRTNVQIHVANVPSELRGCVGVGDSFKTLDLHEHGPEFGVGNSKLTLQRLLRALPHEFELEVVDVD